MFGINGAELLVLLLIAVVVVGPQRLPEFAEQLAGWVRSLRTFARDARERVSEELHESGADVDWVSLDPRRYDPRRIVREALLDEDGAPPSPAGRADGPRRPVARGGAAATGLAASGLAVPADGGEPPLPPFDPDLT